MLKKALDKLKHVLRGRANWSAWNRAFRYNWMTRNDGRPAETLMDDPQTRGFPCVLLLGLVLIAVLGVLLGLWFIRLTQQKPAPLTAAPIAGLPQRIDEVALSPDGARLAFTSDWQQPGNTDLYVKPVGFGAPIRLTNHPAAEYSPTWSPDGSSIGFLRAAKGQCQGPTEVVVISASGGGERKVGEVSLCPDLLPLPGPFLAWAPDATSLIVSDQSPPGEPLSLYVLSLETGLKRRLTSPPTRAPGDSGPAFSPDGRVLAYTRFTGLGVGDIYVLPLRDDLTPAKDPERRTFENRFSALPAWTPDGAEIVYSLRWAGQAFLYRVKAAGPDPPRRLEKIGEGAAWHTISAQTRRLAYVRPPSGANIARLELNAAGSQASEAGSMLRSARFDGFADYSPDGRRIAFASARSGSLEVWVCSSDGGDCVQLTSLRAPFTGFPRWSPDGQRIAFFSNADGHSDIYVVPATGGTPRWLAPDPADDILPSWARDGYSIYFASNRTGRYQVWKAPVFESGVGAAQVTRQGGLAAFESNDGRFLYYTKDHKFATALWRVPLSATGAPAGAETLVTQPVLAAGFAVTSRGLYYLVPGPYSVTAASIHFLSFSGGRTELVAALGKPAHQGLSVAPDGRSILYTQIDRPGQAVMLVENFR